MKFAEKKQAYHDLRGSGHLEADRELLRKKAPHAHALNIGIIDPGKSQREILWALLDVATIAEIKANRKPAEQPKDPAPKNESDMTAAEAENELLTINSDTAPQKTLARLARVLKAQVTDFKTETLQKWVHDYKLKMPKEDQGDGKTKTEVPADLDKVNELTAENEDLKSELEEKELENEDLQDQVDELEEQLEEEKKSPKATNPDPAAPSQDQE